MKQKKPKSTDALMKYLRTEKNMEISGSVQKKKIRNIGYYHGYKGYRYISNPSNRINYAKFDELVAVYDFDAQLKALFYPCVMMIETALKNRVLEVIVNETQSDSFIKIYNNVLDNYKGFSLSGKKFANTEKRKKAEERYKRELKKRLDLRNRIYKVQTDAYSNDNKIAGHYLSKDVNLPIWAIFELLSLGEFGHFVSCANYQSRKQISLNLGIQQSDDSNALLPQRLIYAMKDLRNAIAHNDVVFDTRFRTNDIDNQVSNAISNATGIQGLSFETITDYLILIIYLEKLLGTSKTDMKRMISGFEESREKLRNAIPVSVYNQIIHTDSNNKIKLLRNFVSK